MVFAHSVGWPGIVTVLFLLLPGIAVMGGSVWIGLYDDTVKPGAEYALFALGLGTSLTGAACTFWRLKKVIDVEAGTVLDRWVLFGYTKSTTYELDIFSGVAVAKGSVRSGAGARYRRFKVYLTGADDIGEVRVYLTEFSSHNTALATANEVAAFTGLPMIE